MIVQTQISCRFPWCVRDDRAPYGTSRFADNCIKAPNNSWERHDRLKSELTAYIEALQLYSFNTAKASFVVFKLTLLRCAVLVGLWDLQLGLFVQVENASLEVVHLTQNESLVQVVSRLEHTQHSMHTWRSHKSIYDTVHSSWIKSRTLNHANTDTNIRLEPVFALITGKKFIKKFCSK